MRVVFMGTPLFAVPTLDSLAKTSHTIVGVYSQAPKPKGRGHKVQKSPVHELGESLGLNVLTPGTLKTPEAVQVLKDLKPDVGVVVAYGKILPKEILSVPPMGFINVHASLLPRWRGAAPLQRALMAGDQQSGVTIMEMEEGLDTGPMISWASVPIDPTTTLMNLHDSLAALGADLLTRVLDDVPWNATPQPHEGITYAHKIRKEEGGLDWTHPAQQLLCHVRGLNPWPGTFFYHEKEAIKVLDAEIIPQEAHHAKGAQVGTVLDDRLAIQCAQGIFRPLRLQKPGKGPMDLEDFLRGHPISRGTLLKE